MQPHRKSSGTGGSGPEMRWADHARVALQRSPNQCVADKCAPRCWVGLDDPQRSLPTPTILWFCDSVFAWADCFDMVRICTTPAVTPAALEWHVLHRDFLLYQMWSELLQVCRRRPFSRIPGCSVAHALKIVVSCQNRCKKIRNWDTRDLQCNSQIPVSFSESMRSTPVTNSSSKSTIPSWN